MQNPKALVEYIESLGIIGATITDIMLRYGEIYDLGTINRIYSALELEEFSCYQEPIILGIDVDTPITLVTDKCVFEFEFGDASTVTFAIDALNENPVAHPHRQYEFDIKRYSRLYLVKRLLGTLLKQQDGKRFPITSQDLIAGV